MTEQERHDRHDEHNAGDRSRGSKVVAEGVGAVLGAAAIGVNLAVQAATKAVNAVKGNSGQQQ